MSANTYSAESGHWYTRDGQPAYTTIGKNGKERPTTLTDARKLNLIPSVTTILKTMASEGIVQYRINQAVMAAMTTPMKPGEKADAFVERVFMKEKQHEQERKTAADRGTSIHAAIARRLEGKECIEQEAIDRIIQAVLAEYPIASGEPLRTERVATYFNGVGTPLYAGMIDLHYPMTGYARMAVIDFKTTKTIPKEQYPEHRLQLAAYAGTVRQVGWSPNDLQTDWISKHVRTVNVYINSQDLSQFKIIQTPTWVGMDWGAFMSLYEVWAWKNNWEPQ